MPLTKSNKLFKRTGSDGESSKCYKFEITNLKILNTPVPFDLMLPKVKATVVSFTCDTHLGQSTPEWTN